MNEQPVALITGALRGIGEATAHAFAAAGYRLAAVATKAASLEGLVAKVPTRILALAGDLGDFSFVESIVPQVLSTFGRIDVLINNAAWRELVSMRRISRASWERTLGICLTAPAFLSRWAAQDMERRGRGVIINVSSVMSQQAAGHSPAYIACKGAIDSLTYELASLYGPSGIRVLGVQPGAIDTQLSRDAGGADEEDEIRVFSEDMIMLRRWGRPEEIADVLVFLASDGASYLTGAMLPIDGGWMRQHLPLSLKRRNFPQDYP